MSEQDEDVGHGPVDEEPDSTPPPKPDSLVITVTGYDATQAMQYVAGQVLSECRNDVKREVDVAIKHAVSEATPELIRARVGAEVDKCLAEGWQPTNQWGESAGKRVTLRERIEQELSKKISQGYNKPDTTMVEQLVRSTIEGTLAKEFDALYTAAKEKFKAALDSKFAETLNAALKAGFGGR